MARVNRLRDTSGVRDTAAASLNRQAARASAAALAADSLRRAVKRDSLFREIALCKERYTRFPSSPDSIFGASEVGPSQLLHSDAIGLTDAVRTMPAVVAVPFSLSSGTNRFMLYGFPLLPNSVFLDNSALPDCPTALAGNDVLFATQIDAAVAAAPAGIACTQIPYGLVIPQTDLLWENAVFDENVLGVRFARPITQTFDVSLCSNYRYFAPYTYSTAGDMTSLFNYFISDTSQLANGGRNPLSNETQMSLRLASHTERWGTASLSYSYEDATNDLAMQQTDSLNNQFLQWETIWRYANTLRAQARSFPAGRLMINMDARAVAEGNSATIPVLNSPVDTQETGRNTDIEISVEPFFPLPADTLLATCAVEHQERTFYNRTKAAASLCDARLGYRHEFSFRALSASVKGSLGDGAIKPAGGAIDHSFVYSAEISAAAGRQTLHLFAFRDHLPFVFPYDSLNAPVQSYYDVYNAYGAELFLGYKKIGLSAGICGVSGVDTSAAARFWPDGTMPYQQPRVSLMAMPMFGRWLGFALGSRLIVSDERPFIKSQTTLSYEAQPIGPSEHITVDLVYDYWGARDTVTYGGINLWNREIHNLSLRTSVHIQAFNIFWKVDNLLDRKYAYVPGYFMPGITFRWGFGWLIQ